MPYPYSDKSLEIFNLSKKMVVACYALTHMLPNEEKTNLTRYIRTAALSAHVHIAQGIFLKKRSKRDRYISRAQNALVVIDASVEVLIEVGFAKDDQAREVMDLSSVLYQTIDGLKKDK
jgi:four helix bundle protein